MKIIFLDVDGVLNNADTIARADRATEENPAWHETHIDLEMMGRLNDLLQRSGAHVVVSSSWRHGYTLEELVAIFLRRGLSEEFAHRFVGVTPTTEHKERGHEIQAWMDGLSKAVGDIDKWQFPVGIVKSVTIEAFVILDDDSDMAHLRPYLVQTSFWEGLQDKHVEAALAVLAGP